MLGHILYRTVHAVSAVERQSFVWCEVFWQIKFDLPGNLLLFRSKTHSHPGVVTLPPAC